LTPEVEQKLTKKLRIDPSDFYGSKVAKLARMNARTDGPKLLLADGSWVCYRLSGTEPVVRVYCEARSREGLTKLGEMLSEAAKAWIFD
jgi:phosphoglucomutase